MRTLSTIITQPAACAVCVTIFKNGGKFRLVAIFTQLLALTVVGRSNALLYQIIQCCVEPDAGSTVLCRARCTFSRQFQ